MTLHPIAHFLLRLARPTHTARRELADVRLERNCLVKLVAISDAENTHLRDELTERDHLIRVQAAHIERLEQRDVVVGREMVGV